MPTDQRTKPKVFISHSSKDHEFVHGLAADLERDSVDCWVDEGEVKVGDRLRDKIERGIEQSDFMIVVLSKASTHRSRKSSSGVNMEAGAALIRERENRPARSGQRPTTPSLSGRCVIGYMGFGRPTIPSTSGQRGHSANRLRSCELVCVRVGSTLSPSGPRRGVRGWSSTRPTSRGAPIPCS